MSGIKRLEKSHDGWLGEPFASDFGAAWGIILLEDIYDGTSQPTLQSAIEEAYNRKMRYIIYAPRDHHSTSRVKGERKLYVRKSKYALEINYYLRFRESTNDRAVMRYATEPDYRAKARANALRWREENFTYYHTLQQAYRQNRDVTPEQRAEKAEYMRTYMPEYYERFPERLERKREIGRLYMRKKRALEKAQKESQKEGE